MLSGGLLARYLNETRLVRTRPRIQALVGYMVQYLLPAVLTLVLTLYASRFLQDTVGRSLGMSLTYAGSAGVFCVALVLALSSMFEVGHKRIAVQIIRKYSRRPLFLIGFLPRSATEWTARKLPCKLAKTLRAVCRFLPGSWRAPFSPFSPFGYAGLWRT